MSKALLNPFEDLRHGFLTNFFDDANFVDDDWLMVGRRFYPTVDIKENDTNYELAVELPGVPKNEVTVEVHDHTLTIHGEKKFKEESKEGNVYRMESRYGSFSRSFTLPDVARSEEIKAELKDGILTLSIPKAEETKPKLVKIE